MANLRLTRRRLLQFSAIGVASGALSILVSACGGQSQSTATPTSSTALTGASTGAATTPTAAASTSGAAAASGVSADAIRTITAPASGGSYPASVSFGINLPFTGADAADAANRRDGALMAIDQIDAAGGIGGRVKINPLVKDDGTVAAGQYDPAQAATNMRQFVADGSVMGVIGPQKSGSGKAMSPIASLASLVLITPSSTNPEITDPKYAPQYRPKGKAIYFRTVTTDAFQGPFIVMMSKANGLLGQQTPQKA